MRYTEKRNGKNVIPLRNAVCGVDLPKWSIDKHSDIQSFLSGDAVDRLAELENKIEQGKMIELPCKVGDKVYVIEYKGRFVGFKVLEEYCSSITFDGKKYWVNREVYEYDGFDGYVFGEYAFLTREEAEKRLKELQG